MAQIGVQRCEVEFEPLVPQDLEPVLAAAEDLGAPASGQAAEPATVLAPA
jgi:hypothetical protein